MAKVEFQIQTTRASLELLISSLWVCNYRSDYKTSRRIKKPVVKKSVHPHSVCSSAPFTFSQSLWRYGVNTCACVTIMTYFTTLGQHHSFKNWHDVVVQLFVSPCDHISSHIFTRGYFCTALHFSVLWCCCFFQFCKETLSIPDIVWL